MFQHSKNSIPFAFVEAYMVKGCESVPDQLAKSNDCIMWLWIYMHICKIKSANSAKVKVMMQLEAKGPI